MSKGQIKLDTRERERVKNNEWERKSKREREGERERERDRERERERGERFKPKSIEQLMHIDLLPLLWSSGAGVTF